MIRSDLANQLICRYVDAFPTQSTSNIDELSDPELIELLSGLRPSYSASIINRLPTSRSANILLMLPDLDFVQTFRSLDPVKGASLIAKSTRPEKLSKLQLLTHNEQQEIEELSHYPADSAGSLMDTSVMCLRESDTVESAIKKIREDKRKTLDIWVTDLEGKLVGSLPASDLLHQENSKALSELMKPNPPRVNGLDPRELVIEAFEKTKSSALPVTHIDGTVLGAIRYESLIHAVQDQATEAIASMVGASPEERALSPSLFAVKKRLPWLGINLLTAFLASAVVGFFEATIATITALAVLLPIVAGQSGNTGAQAMAVTMRGLALREVRTLHWVRVLFKELRAGFVNGIVIAGVTGLSVYFWSQNSVLGVVMTVAMIFSMVVASMAGAAIPMVLTALGRDPAQSSSVILTTVTDVVGFMSFLGLATLLKSMLV